MDKCMNVMKIHSLLFNGTVSDSKQDNQFVLAFIFTSKYEGHRLTPPCAIYRTKRFAQSLPVLVANRANDVPTYVHIWTSYIWLWHTRGTYSTQQIVCRTPL